jgi:hypothetical protein
MTGVRTAHDDHQKVRWIPVYLPIDELTRSGCDQLSKRYEDTHDPLHRYDTEHKADFAVSIAGKVALVGHTGCFLPDGLVQTNHHEPRDAPSGLRRHVLPPVEDWTHTLGSRKRPNHHCQHRNTAATAGDEEGCLKSFRSDGEERY